MDKLAAVWSVTSELVERRVVPFIIFFLVIIPLQEHVVTILAEEVKISLSLAQQIASLTAGIYLAVYLVAQLLRSVMPGNRDGLVALCLVAGLLIDSFRVALLLLIVTVITIKLLQVWRENEKLRTWWAARSDRVQSTMILLLTLIAGAVLLWAGWVAS